MNRSVGRHLFGVPPSGGPDRLKPAKAGTPNGWFMESLLSFFECIGAMNRLVLVLVLVLEDNSPNRGRGRERRRGRNDGSWRASTTSSSRIGTMSRFVLVLVVVLEDKPPDRGRARERRRGRKDGSTRPNEHAHPPFRLQL